MTRISFIWLLLAAPFISRSQMNAASVGDSLYKAKNFEQAARHYLLAAQAVPKYQNPKNYYYNAACCFALVNDRQSAIKYLRMAVDEHGYRNYDNMGRDSDLVSLHEDTAWTRMMTSLKRDRERLADPRRAKLVTADIHHFWEAFDAAASDTAHRKEIFTSLYFDRSSVGLQDYFETKIRTIDGFVKNQQKKPRFYRAIRNNTLFIDKMKEDIYGYFDKLKELYADAVFPDIYFVIGKWNSAGTVSDNGLLLGVDQISRTAGIPEDELNLWEKNNYQDLSKIPVIVIHELVHFEQQQMKEDTTLLCYTMIEGMADFICELVTGANPSQRLQEYAKSRRQEIWNNFQKEMYLARVYNWIANGDQETKDKPADLGYYMGYEICKAYYEKASDKKQAIKDMLTIQDYRQFLEKSGYAEKMK